MRREADERLMANFICTQIILGLTAPAAPRLPD